MRIPFWQLLTLLFIGLKLGDVIDWSWWWVLSPALITWSWFIAETAWEMHKDGTLWTNR